MSGKGIRQPARHHWIVRATHWINAVAFTIMVGSGLRIFNAYPQFARKGETFCCYPFEGRIPAWLTFGGWLGGARHWHFAMMWVLVATGLVYVAFIYLHGEWRDLVPRRGDLRDAIQMIRFYTYARKDHPAHGKHNALQKGAYFVMPILAAMIVVSGIAIWKPVSLGWLTNALGGYVWARYWHFSAMVALVGLSLVHVFMVLSVDPYSLRSMITGGHSERFSPIARNARPFQGLLPKPVVDPVDVPAITTTETRP
jgi:thiosulfate reductase cytochrome b subunit